MISHVMVGSNNLSKAMELNMKINPYLLKHERNKRAWSQEHLAQVAGIGLRTVQRIETSGRVSNASIASIATALEMAVADFVEEMPRQAREFESVRAIGTALPGVKDATSRRGVALKLKGRMLACEAINRSAEPNSLMLSISLKRRKALMALDPGAFYLTAHYAPYPVVLVRLPRIKQTTLKELLRESWEFMQSGAS